MSPLSRWPPLTTCFWFYGASGAYVCTLRYIVLSIWYYLRGGQTHWSYNSTGNIDRLLAVTLSVIVGWGKGRLDNAIQESIVGLRRSIGIGKWCHGSGIHPHPHNKYNWHHTLWARFLCRSHTFVSPEASSSSLFVVPCCWLPLWADSGGAPRRCR